MSTSAEKLVLKIFETCAGKSGCGGCRSHMEDDCLFFPELCRLQDQTEDSGLPFSTNALCQLLDLCTMCGLCPCPDIKMLILQAERHLPISPKENFFLWGKKQGLTFPKCNTHTGALKVAYFAGCSVGYLFPEVENGYEIVFSCPTCGYFFKKILLENAYYSDAYQAVSGAGSDVMKVPSGSRNNTFYFLPKKNYQKILIDDGY